MPAVLAYSDRFTRKGRCDQTLLMHDTKQKSHTYDEYSSRYVKFPSVIGKMRILNGLLAGLGRRCVFAQEANSLCLSLPLSRLSSGKDLAILLKIINIRLAVQHSGLSTRVLSIIPYCANHRVEV